MTTPDPRPRLLAVVASTRPGRVGGAVGAWFAGRATAHGGFDVEHPKLRRYVHQHTKDWSATVDAADAVVLVLPVYNHGMTAPLKNALVAVEAVSIPLVQGHVTDGRLAPPAAVDEAATTMLDELRRLDGALRPLRVAARRTAA